MSVENLLALFGTSLLGILGWIAVSINDMSKNLAVVVFRIDNHEDRIKTLEDVKNN